MDVKDLLLAISAELEKRKIPFMVVGGVALAAWVEPRLTDDVDLIVSWPKKHQSILKEALIAVGAKPTSTPSSLHRAGTSAGG